MKWVKTWRFNSTANGARLKVRIGCRSVVSATYRATSPIGTVAHSMLAASQKKICCSGRTRLLSAVGSWNSAALAAGGGGGGSGSGSGSFAQGEQEVLHGLASCGRTRPAA